MPQIARVIEWDYGHRVLGHEGKCRFLHGHRGKAEVTVRAPELDSLGRVIDFGVLKEKVGGWVRENWDHNLLLHPDDPLLFRGDPPEVADNKVRELLGRKPYVMPGGANPTAECIAEVLFDVVRTLLPGVEVVRVRVYETPGCYADYTGKEGT